MGLIILFCIINFIIWFIILPIILIKYFGCDECCFYDEFIFCGFIVTMLSIIGTTFMIIFLLYTIIFPLYQKYIRFINKN